MDNVKKRKNVILVVDDDTNFRRSIVEILEDHSYRTLEATDGKMAIEVLAMNEVDVIISDIRMPKMHGIELFHRIRKRKEIPFIMMTGFSDIIDVTEAYGLGVSGFLAKPFKQDELISTVNEIFREWRSPPFSEREQKRVGSGQEYCKIPVDEFICGSQINGPIYIKLASQKLIKIALSGEDLPPSRIEELKGKGLHYFYLRKEDYKKYINFNTSVSNLITTNPKIANEKKTKFLRHTSNAILEYSFAEAADGELIKLAQNNVEQTINLIMQDQNILNLLDAITKHKNPLFAHSVGVSVVCGLIVKKLKWQTAATFFRITTAALFHDLGNGQISPKILNKPYNQLNEREWELIKEAPRIAAKKINSIKGLPGEIEQIILHHHERNNGSGFPQGLVRAKIHPMAQLLAVADEFCYLYKGHPGQLRPLSATEAVDYLFEHKEKVLTREYLNVLAEIFQEGS